MSSSTTFTAPEVIDEAGLVSKMLTLNESRKTETDRAKSQHTLEGVHDPNGINIHEYTLEEPKTDTVKGPNSVDSKGLNCQDCKTRVHMNKQSPDLAEDVADGDFDDLVVQVPQVQDPTKCKLLQAGEKQPENDVSGRVSESRKCFQLWTPFRDTSSEHSTLEIWHPKHSH